MGARRKAAATRPTGLDVPVASASPSRDEPNGVGGGQIDLGFADLTGGEPSGSGGRSPFIAPASDVPDGGSSSEPQPSAKGGRYAKGAPPLHGGHRDRLRHRFKTGGDAALPDYELLELLLFRSIPRQDTKPLAKRLIARFGSFAGVLNAPEPLLLEVQGVGEAVAIDLKIIRASALRLLKSEALEKPVLSSWSAVMNYVRAAMAYEDREQLRVIFLDKKNRLIADEVQQQGTVDHTPVYVREIVKRALELSATAIIILHNHPSGDPTPSQADIQMTKRIVEAAGNLGIVVHDHIVVARDGHASFRALGLLN